jgi:hypothetical protein
VKNEMNPRTSRVTATRAASGRDSRFKRPQSFAPAHNAAPMNDIGRALKARTFTNVRK